MEPPPEFLQTFLAAASCGDLLLLQSFVDEFENGEGPEQISYANLKAEGGSTALHRAAFAGQTEICKYLIEILKFDVNTTDDNGETPLFRAVIVGHLKTAVFLLEKGADATKRNNKGDTLLHTAVISNGLPPAAGSKELLKLLVSNGAVIHLHANSSLEGMPLHLAAAVENHDALEYLLELGADPNSTTPTYVSPLLFTTVTQSTESMELLLKAGADPNGHSLQLPPIFCAITDLNGWIVSRLLIAGADPNKTDISGKTPLEHAALIGFREAVEQLFPLTSPITGYPDWSPMGFEKHLVSEKATALRESKQKEQNLLAKAKGGEALKRKDYIDATYWFQQAATADPEDAEAWYQRSLCHSHMKLGGAALSDARDCLRLDPKWAKAHYSEGVAWNVMQDYNKAAEAFSRAQALDRGNKVFKKAYRAACANRKYGFNLPQCRIDARDGPINI